MLWLSGQTVGVNSKYLVVLEFTNHHARKQTNQTTQNLVYKSRTLILKVAEVKWEESYRQTEDLKVAEGKWEES